MSLLSKLEYAEFENLTKISVSVIVSLLVSKPKEPNMPIKPHHLIDWVYDKHISMSHGNSTLRRQRKMSYLSKLEYAEIENLTKISV